MQTKALKMAIFTNGGVLAGLKIRHFQGFTVLGTLQSKGIPKNEVGFHAQ